MIMDCHDERQLLIAPHAILVMGINPFACGQKPSVVDNMHNMWIEMHIGFVGSAFRLEGWLIPKGQKNSPPCITTQWNILMAYPCPTQDSNLVLKCTPQQGEGTGIVHNDCI